MDTLIFQPESDNVEPPRKPYYPPKFEDYGTIKTVTLGSFPGTSDSGGLGDPL